jgi:(R,R)-butanediol dehydrogenase/meso-butanediol dehydrogenase/diacetyl reductase
MKAAVLSGARQILIKDVPRPEPGPDEVLVKVEYGGICGSDIHAYQDLTFPIGTILGHEFTGTIVKLGDSSSGFQEGQRIVARPAGMCGKCEWCHRGELGLCKDHLQNTLGLNLAGGFAEYVKMKSYQAISLADEISFQEGAQLEPLAVSFHAVKLAPLRVGEAVAIFGAGPIGLLVLQLVRAAGARPIYVIEKSSMRREKATNFGAEFVWPPTSDLLEKIRWRERVGVNVVFDCVGIEETLQNSLDVVKPGGKIVMIGISIQPVLLNQFRWVVKGVTISGSMGYFVDDFASAIHALQKKIIDVESLISHVFPLGEIEKGMRILENPDQALKVLLRP